MRSTTPINYTSKSKLNPVNPLNGGEAHFMTQDVTLLHGDNLRVVKMEIGAANRCASTLAQHQLRHGCSEY